MTRKKFVLILFILIFNFSQTYLYSSIKVDQKKIINRKKSYTIGDILEYEIKLKISDNLKIEKINDIKDNKWEILSRDFSRKRNTLIIYRKYQLFSYKQIKLPDIELNIIKKTTNNKYSRIIKGIKVNIASSLSKNENKIKDIMPPQKDLDTNYSSVPLIVTILIILSLIALFYFLYYKLKQLRKKSTPPQKIWEKQINPIEFLEREWSKLNFKNYIRKGKIKILYYKITDILKKFLSIFHKKNYIDMTTTEFKIEYDKEKISQNIKQTLCEFLDFADLVKFAKYKPQKDEIYQIEKIILKTLNYYRKLESQKENSEK